VVSGHLTADVYGGGGRALTEGMLVAAFERIRNAPPPPPCGSPERPHWVNSVVETRDEPYEFCFNCGIFMRREPTAEELAEITRGLCEMLVEAAKEERDRRRARRRAGLPPEEE
jgi:hypothetical protein